MMHKKGPKAVKEFASYMHKQFGMRVVILGAFMDEDGEPSMTV